MTLHTEEQQAASIFYLTAEPDTAAPAAGGMPVLISPEETFTVYWKPGDRFDQLFQQAGQNFGDRIAVESASDKVTFQQLDGRANQMARYLSAKGFGPGNRLGILADRGAETYAAMLAISKLGAVFVPLDSSFPVDRIQFILDDADCRGVLTQSHHSALFSGFETSVLRLDDERDEIGAYSEEPFSPLEPTQQKTPVGESVRPTDDAPCYIIYTSGTTGKPKGVPINHSAIYNFLCVAREHYGYQELDRVYQGMSVAFDFSVEELWVPLLSGATLVPAPSDVKLLGHDLVDFLIENRITAMCCVPTMLATIDEDLPQLRFLMVSGEACPQDLADRWAKPHRRFLNVYGPTETTVTATWSVIEPGTTLTIGGPLPTYSIVILEPGTSNIVPHGESGEVCIAGIGVAEGYLNRPEKTAAVFIDDFIGIRNDPSGRIYRSGDLGRINEQNQIQYLGRIDTQVKIRGYRIELEEIEAVGRRIDWIDQVVVNPYEEADGRLELVAYYTSTKEPDETDLAATLDEFRRQLPPYMVPSYFEPVDQLPLMSSDKVDRGSLPAPTTSRLSSASKFPYVEPQTETEHLLCSLLEACLSMDRISIEADFFAELDASSLDMARFLSAIRRELGAVCSIRELYENPTIRELAKLFETGKCEAATADEPELAAPRRRRVPRVASAFERFCCGAIQVSFFAFLLLVATSAYMLAFAWVTAGDHLIAKFVRAALSGLVLFWGSAALMTATKWLVLGRFTTEPIPIWSVHYARFWIAKTCIQFHPMSLFVGSPLYSVFLRSMGMKVGKNSLIFSRPPICTDLISIGDETLIRADCHLPGYTAHGGYIYAGSVEIGSRSFVAEACVLDIDTRIGDDAELGTASGLLEGQRIPDGKTFQGSPAVPSETMYCRVPWQPISRVRWATYTLWQLSTELFLVAPIIQLIAFTLTELVMSVALTGETLASTFAKATAVASVSYFGNLLLLMLTVVTIPRVLNWFVVPHKVHPLFGIQYFLSRSISTLSNSQLLNTIFGDSSLIVYYLQSIGYDLSETTQTGSNFGVSQRHHSPFLVKFHRNTLVSDVLAVVNMETSQSSFQMKRVNVAADNYLGNMLHVPADSKVGENCLIATRAMIPIDGPIRRDVGILGSPPFEIPRTVSRDTKFEHFKQPEVLRQRLWMKLHSNLVTIGIYLLRNWIAMVALTLVAMFLIRGLADASSVSIVLVLTMVVLIAAFLFTCYMTLFQRFMLWLFPMRPLYCSLYERDFWLHERNWKMNNSLLLSLFDGTPLKTWFVRLVGVKMGRNVFDDGGFYSEPTLVTVGDNCCINQASLLQGHSLEDGSFKSDHIVVEDGCTVEVHGLVHYGTHLKRDSVVRADSFLMKGAVMEQDAIWYGNPAREWSGPKNTDRRERSSETGVVASI